MTREEVDFVMGQLAAEVIMEKFDPVVLVIRVLYLLAEHVTQEEFEFAVKGAKQVPFVRLRDRKPS